MLSFFAIAHLPGTTRLLQPLREVVTRTADLRRIAAGVGAVAGELRLGTIATASTGILPVLLKTLTLHRSDLDLFIVPGTSPELCEQVLDATIDAAIMVQPPSPLRKDEGFLWLCCISLRARPKIELSDFSQLCFTRGLRRPRRSHGLDRNRSARA